jgi:peptidoglycan/xylan/chitin deacetylase (PgdA/CDA1 family)
MLISGIRVRVPSWMALLAVVVGLVLVLAGCDAGSTPATPTPVEPTATSIPTVQPTETLIPVPTYTPTVEPTATQTPIPVSERGYVPVLCFHHIRDWVNSDTEEETAYIMPPSQLEEWLTYLKDNGYTGVTATQVWEYYALGKPLPDKPVALTFDDDDDNQYTEGVPLLQKYGFTATFFIQTVTLDKENYMTSDQVKELSSLGYDVQPHTWDHHMITEYETDEDWELQIAGPKKTLEELTGKEASLLAYPFGIYDAASAEKLKSYGYKGAFRLREMMDDAADPVFAIKRYIANPYFTDEQLQLVLEGEWE